MEHAVLQYSPQPSLLQPLNLTRPTARSASALCGRLRAGLADHVSSQQMFASAWSALWLLC